MLSCSKCKRELPRDNFSPNSTKRNGFHDWCRTCVKENTRKWYLKNKARAKATSLRWAHQNPEKRKAIVSRYYLKHKTEVLERNRLFKRTHREEISEYNRAYLQKAKLNIYLLEIGYPVVFSNKDESCDACGMLTKKNNLYKFDGRTLCWQCLKDSKETSLTHPRIRFVFPKKECQNCHRIAIDVKNGMCIDCRVAEKRKAYERTWALLTDKDFEFLGPKSKLSTEDLV